MFKWVMSSASTNDNLLLPNPTLHPTYPNSPISLLSVNLCPCSIFSPNSTSTSIWNQFQQQTLHQLLQIYQPIYMQFSILNLSHRPLAKQWNPIFYIILVNPYNSHPCNVPTGYKVIPKLFTHVYTPHSKYRTERRG